MLCSGRFVCLITLVLITVAAVVLLALAFIVTNAAFFLAAVLLTIPIFLPIVTSILAWIVSHQQVVILGERPYGTLAQNKLVNGPDDPSGEARGEPAQNQCVYGYSGAHPEP